jgi:hypothetical protein
MKMARGYRQLKPTEILRERDEFCNKRWHITSLPGKTVEYATGQCDIIYRRRIKGASRKGVK